MGESHAVSNLRKRDGEAEPFHFLDCPSNVTDVPESQTHVARVVCLSDDINGCFQVTEKGVEGTIVEMPENMSASFRYFWTARLTNANRARQTLLPELYRSSSQMVGSSSFLSP
jgi:chitinase